MAEIIQTIKFEVRLTTPEFDRDTGTVFILEALTAEGKRRDMKTGGFGVVIADTETEAKPAEGS